METPPPSHPHATVGRGKGGDYTYFDPEQPVGEAWGRHLPHWRQPGAIYFVTSRTADSIPASVLAQWRNEREAWLAAHPLPHDEQTARAYHQKFTRRFHRYLDEGHSACPFREVDARASVVDTMNHRDGIEYALDAFVVMPNHLHALVCPHDGFDLNQITKTWKSVSAHRVNRLLSRHGGLWQEESWDHVVRDPGHLDRFRSYIEANVRALLGGERREPPPGH